MGYIVKWLEPEKMDGPTLAELQQEIDDLIYKAYMFKGVYDGKCT